MGSRLAQVHHQGLAEGVVRVENTKLTKKRDGTVVVMNRHGLIKIFDDSGRERENYNLTYGAQLKVANGARVTKGTMLAEWDPYAIPILTEVDGIIKYGDIVDGVIYLESAPFVTGEILHIDGGQSAGH